MTDADTDTAPCSKCGIEIPVSADRCPACGYEPGSSILLRLAFWLFSAPFGAFVGFLAVAGTAGMFVGEIAFSEWLGVLLGCAIIGAVPGAVGYYYFSRRRRSPTD
jgi:hypothetical protein